MMLLPGAHLVLGGVRPVNDVEYEEKCEANAERDEVHFAVQYFLIDCSSVTNSFYYTSPYW